MKTLFFLISTFIMSTLCSVHIFAQKSTGSKVNIDFRADLMKPVKIGDSTALTLSGHVVFYHNGAVITCDSAIRYNSHLMECFNNVIINQKDTYIYGDKATYDGLTNTATVYSNIIKTVDKDAILYTYNFSFNTLNKVGYYTGGGTMSQGKNLMESTNGYYYTSTRSLVGVDNVEMRSPEYNIKADSVSYNLDTEIAEFYSRSYIWNDKDEFLTANRGSYSRKTQTYKFTNDSYALTASQEVWADTILYEQEKENALLMHNVQILDEEQRSMAFGEYAQYWGDDKRALLTQNPSILSYDKPAQPDTTYMRSDSILIFTVAKGVDSLKTGANSLMGDSLGTTNSGLLETEANMPNKSADSPKIGADSLIADSIDPNDGSLDTSIDSPIVESLTGQGGEKLDDIKSLDSKMTPTNIETKSPDNKKPKKQKIKRVHSNKLTNIETKELNNKKSNSKNVEIFEPLESDSLKSNNIDGSNLLNRSANSTSTAVIDSLINSANITKIEQDSTAKPAADSVDRVIRAYRNVKIFRNDFQAVCDSLVGFSADSTFHLYINPVAWSDNNQIKSEEIAIHTRNQMISKAVFTGEPIMSSRLDSIHFNQVKGKIIEAIFTDGNISKTNVNGNAQSYYFMEDGDSTDRYINGMLNLEGADMVFYFENKEITKIVPKNDISFELFPMDKIPDTQPILMKNFVWEEERMITKLDVFDRTIRPSERTKYEAIPKPTYSITDRLDNDRVRLIKDGTWFERNDKLNEEAMEFLRTLGH